MPSSGSKAPFEKFSIFSTYRPYTVCIIPKLTKPEDEQLARDLRKHRDFIEQAIREKLERERKP